MNREAPVPSSAAGEGSPRYAGWRVVAGCFVMAIFAWGFGFYGNALYLAELSRLRGWPLSLIASATTLYYLLGAVLVVFVSDVIARIGPRAMVVSGAALLGLAAIVLGHAQAPWQLFAGYFVLAPAWAAMSSAAINNVLGLWFDRRRGLAVSLALNGASAGGFTVVPVLVAGVSGLGFGNAMSVAGAASIMFLAPLLWVMVSAPPGAASQGPQPARTPASVWTRGRALRSPRFWSISGAFAAVLLAQVGILVHLIAFLEPGMGRSQAALAVALIAVMAVVGRLVVGLMAHRADLRRLSALSFLSQAAAVMTMVLSPDPAVRLVASAVFGFSVGNVITFPSLILHREFEPAAFGMLVGLSTAIGQVVYAFGPMSVALLRDVSGGYAVPLVACAAFQALAAGVLLFLRPRDSSPSGFAGSIAPGD